MEKNLKKKRTSKANQKKSVEAVYSKSRDIILKDAEFDLLYSLYPQKYKLFTFRNYLKSSFSVASSICSLAVNSANLVSISSLLSAVKYLDIRSQSSKYFSGTFVWSFFVSLKIKLHASILAL